MKRRSKKDTTATAARLRKPRGKGPANADGVREPRESLRLPTWRAPKTGSLFATSVDACSNRSMLDAADESEPADRSLQLGAFLDEWEEKHGAFTRAELDQAVREIESRYPGKYRTAGDVLADMPLPEFAAKLRVTRVPRTVRNKIDIAPRFSNHMFHDAFSVTVHAIAAQKILKNPRLVERARKILERWISKQTPAPKPFLEWRNILAGTPPKIAAVAMALTEESTRLRSSSPLGFVLSPTERAAISAVFGKKVARATPLRQVAGAMDSTRSILEQAAKTLGSREAAELWLNSPQLGLEGKRPVDLMATIQGAQVVESLLMRMTYGVYT